MHFLFEETLFDTLAVEYFNPCGIGQPAMLSLFDRAQRTPELEPFSLRLIEILCTGRRYGESEPNNRCAYAIFAVAEIDRLVPAVRQVIDAHPQDEGHWLPVVIRELVLEALERARKDQRGIVVITANRSNATFRLPIPLPPLVGRTLLRYCLKPGA